MCYTYVKKHKRHPVVLPIVVWISGVIPKQRVASLAKLNAWGFDYRRQQSSYGRHSSLPVKDWWCVAVYFAL
jgi:hypothetical protein